MNPSQQEWRILKEFTKGNPHAFSAVFQQYNSPLCTFASDLVANKEDGEDIVKDTFVKLWQKHADFDTPQNIKAFLYITTRNSCLNFLRHLQLHHAAHKEFVYLDHSQQGPVIYSETIQQEAIEDLQYVISTLSNRQQQVFKMSYLDGLTKEEISEQLNISIHTVVRHLG